MLDDLRLSIGLTLVRYCLRLLPRNAIGYALRFAVYQAVDAVLTAEIDALDTEEAA